MPLLGEAIDHLIEANVALRKRRALAKLERQLAAAMGKAFAAEGRAFLGRLARYEGRFAPAVREAVEISDWGPLFDDAAIATANVFQRPLDDLTARAIAAGQLAAIAELGIEASFTLEHPEAVSFLRRRGVERVAQIQLTTRDQLRTILTQAADQGWSYTKTAKAIRDRYEDFSAKRARNIAVYELGDAYEHGNMLVARDLQDGGLEVEKSWLTVGDHKVRPDHRANQAQGWIPIDDLFQDGRDRPPTDPGCRCTLLMRRKPDDVPAADQPGEEFDRSAWNADRKDLYDEWAKTATPDEISAVTRYKGARYMGINKMLRTGNAPASQLADLKSDVKLIDKALAKSRLDRDIRASRGVRFDFDAIPDSWTKLQAGDTIKDPGYVSTSTASKTADRFAKKGPGSFLLDITIPKGSRGLWIDPLGDKATKEDEILLPRDTTFIVREVVKERNGRTRLKVEVVL